jgi:Mor family transcriptional regulator
VRTRLGQAAIDELVASFRAGTPKHELAKKYEISLSSVKRVLRRSESDGAAIAELPNKMIAITLF